MDEFTIQVQKKYNSKKNSSFSKNQCMTYYNIEIFRFIFTIAILLGHASRPEFSGQKIAQNFIADYSIAVEFFYIITGFFLKRQIEKKYSLIEFMKIKWTRLIPVYIFCCILHIFAYNFGFIKQSFHFRNEFLNILFIRDIGFNSFGAIPLENGLWSINTHAWYLGPLFIISLLYFYIGTHTHSYRYTIITIFFVYISFSFRVQNILPGFQGMFRAIYGIGLGCLADSLRSILIEKYKIQQSYSKKMERDLDGGG